MLGGLGALSYVSLLKAAAVAINFGAFVLLADVFYALSRRVLRDEYLAYKVREDYAWMDGPTRFSAVQGISKRLCKMG